MNTEVWIENFILQISSLSIENVYVKSGIQPSVGKKWKQRCTLHIYLWDGFAYIVYVCLFYFSSQLSSYTNVEKNKEKFKFHHFRKNKEIKIASQNW